jgi:hypothetical protein
VAKRLQGFIVGVLLASVVPVAAQEIEVRCAPQIINRVDCSRNVLELHFETKGQIPNRCKIS